MILLAGLVDALTVARVSKHQLRQEFRQIMPTLADYPSNPTLLISRHVPPHKNAALARGIWHQLRGLQDTFEQLFHGVLRLTGCNMYLLEI